jgi:hypothetical protein
MLYTDKSAIGSILKELFLHYIIIYIEKFCSLELTLMGLSFGKHMTLFIFGNLKNGMP